MALNRYTQLISKAAFLAASMILLVGLNGCGLDQKGLVLVVDPTYKASVIAKSGDGVTVADGLIWTRDGLFIADEGASAVRLWKDRDASTTLSDGSAGILSPEDLAVDDRGNVYFTDDDAGGVWHVDRSGTTRVLAGVDQGLVSTEGVALSPDGTLLVGEVTSGTIKQVTPEGEVCEFLGREAGIKKPESMVFGDDGSLFIADNEDDVLYLRTADGRLNKLIANVENFSPETLWYASGTLYITDSRNGKLFTYSPASGLKVLAVFGGKLRAVSGITTDPEGNIYVSIQTDLSRKVGYLIRLSPEH